MTMAWVHFDIELPGTVLNSREVVREHELAGHLLSAVREQRGNDTHTTYSHIFFIPGTHLHDVVSRTWCIFST